VGTLYPEHLRENIAAVERGPLPAHVYEEAKRRLNNVDVSPVQTA
jgi:hypothetical protein